jgi:hypothetical protein
MQDDQGGFSMSVDLWKSIFDWATIILIALTVFSGAGALITGGIIAKREDATLRQLEASASDAKAAQQKVETELAAQKERTANAEKAASDAALALERFKQPRSLSVEQQDELKSALKPFAGQNFALAVFPDPEALALVRVLDRLLKSASWNRVPSQIHRESGGQSGILVDVAGVTAAQISDSGVDAYIAPDDTESVSAQHTLCSILNATGIHCEDHRTPQLAGKNPRAITVSVGKKP